MITATDIKHHPYYYETDPRKKNYEWAHTLVAMLRGEWQHIVDVKDANEGMQYLRGTQDVLGQLREAFKKGSDFLNKLEKKDLGIAVMDRMKNILVAEFTKGAYMPQVEATDLAADNQKKRDKQLLKGRRGFETLMSDLQMRAGDPPYKMPEEVFEGNVGIFDEMGLDDRNEEDVNFFMKVFHRLWHESDAQELLRALLKSTKFHNHIEDLVEDVLAKNAVTYQVYASPFTGEIKWKYLDPRRVKAISGKSRDKADAVCIGFEERVTVRQFLDFAGPDFMFSRDKEALTRAVNTTNNTDYSYITVEGCWKIDAETGVHTHVASYGSLLKHSVDIGYIEWKSIDADFEGKESKSDGLIYPMTEKDRQKFPEEKFHKTEIKHEKTYKAWFMGTGGNAQYIFRFGPLYHMLTSGAGNEHAGWSIQAFVRNGKSAVKIAEPFIDVVHQAFYKMLWAIDESSPREDVYNYDSIVQLAAAMAPKPSGTMSMGIPGEGAAEKMGIEGAVDRLLQKYRTSLVKMYILPEKEGQKLGGNQRLNYKEEGGIDPLAPAMQVVMEWAETQISWRWGVNPLRDAFAPSSKDGYKINMEATKASRNATYFVPMMLEGIIINSSTCSLMLVQDGIEHGTLVKGYVENLIGTDGLESFRSLEKIPHHSYGIFVDIFNTEQKKEELKMEAQMAYQRQEISYAEYLIVKEIDDHKKAGIVLHFYKERAAKRQAAAEAAVHDRAMQRIQAETESKLMVIDREGEWKVRDQQEWGKYYMAAHQTPHDAAIIKKQMDQDNNAQKMNEKAASQIQVMKAQKELEAIQPLPTSTSSAGVQLPNAEPT